MFPSVWREGTVPLKTLGQVTWFLKTLSDFAVFLAIFKSPALDTDLLLYVKAWFFSVVDTGDTLIIDQVSKSGSVILISLPPSILYPFSGFHIDSVRFLRESIVL